ncbi:nucleotidyltransferase substrate binding protein [Methylophilus methylotrophus]|uniref:nucleotidyltransferase substrate binding protein n=1 Tax=Methylophilus methylotrophus TaxID=17 RepID=UPI0003796E84|nr:nucleotidyltransferase substrate binding protein [Methylophilus methylotrophus]
MTEHNTQNLRWVQRLNNYEKALESLTAAIDLSKERALSDLEKQGLIQAFEFTHELAWNVLKDYFDYQGTQNITGSRDATREAFSKGLILDGEGWMAMIQSRNKTSHTYNKAVAEEIIEAIQNSYYALFVALMHTLKKLQSNLE